jgi:hypothetical protein
LAKLKKASKADLKKQSMPSYVEIRIQGHLDPDWADWLEGFTITHTPDDLTLLDGTVPDQASLYGLIGKLRDMGVQLVSITYRDPPINQA